jgi:hypothetical protein
MPRGQPLELWNPDFFLVGLHVHRFWEDLVVLQISLSVYPIRKQEVTTGNTAT